MGQRAWVAIVTCLCLLPSRRTWGDDAAGQEGKHAAHTPGSKSDCGQREGQACCDQQRCFSFMLECVKDRCQESRMVHVLREGGTFTDGRGMTTKVEISGDLKLMTLLQFGQFMSATLYEHDQIVWQAGSSGESGEPRRSTGITMEEARSMYLGAAPRFDEGPAVRLHLVNVPFRDAAEFFMKLSHQRFNLSAPCGGTVTIVSDEDLKPAEAFAVFESMVSAFQLTMESPLMGEQTIHTGNCSGCGCTLDGEVVTRAFALHPLAQSALKDAPWQFGYARGTHMLSERLLVATERPEVIRQIGFWLEKHDRLDASGKPVVLPDPFPRSKPFRRCPIAF